ncbi:hypothetical protein [Fimbriimonas ginsengisoli]|uniref:hypothetical protein n=1 Tax=Fimbriimonas ginsengisoli TaxID=1005039 RepID=UPI001184ED20|nr:hypothetical protein [Fimbriimonas ginsengisoli]
MCAFALFGLHVVNLAALWGAIGAEPGGPIFPRDASRTGNPLSGALSAVGLAATVPAFVFGALAWSHPRLCRGASLAVSIAAISVAGFERIAPRQPLLGMVLSAISLFAAVGLCASSFVLRRNEHKTEP